MNKEHQTSPFRVCIDRQAAVPLYHQIEKHFSDLIARNVLQPGDQLPGVPSLIRQINVNYRTVRQAYENLADAGLVRIVKGKGTFVTNQADHAKTKTVAVINASPLRSEDGHNYYSLGVYTSIQSTLSDLGWATRLHVLESDVDPVYWVKSVDGCVVFSSSAQTQPVIEHLQKYSIPTVTISGNGTVFPTVRSDDRLGVELLIDHLRNLGHRRIALVTRSLSFYYSQRRLDAYCRCMDRYGLSIRPSWIYAARSTWLEDAEEQDALFDRLFQNQCVPTALVADSGYLGLSLLQMLHRHRMFVPDDVSVCAFDDCRPMAFASPPMTAVRQDLQRIGKTAVEQLLALMEGKAIPRTSLVPVELVVRASTGQGGGDTTR